MKPLLTIALLALAACTKTETKAPAPVIPTDPSGFYVVSWGGLGGNMTLEPSGDALGSSYPCGPRWFGFWVYEGGALAVDVVWPGFTTVRAQAVGDRLMGDYQGICGVAEFDGVKE